MSTSTINIKSSDIRVFPTIKREEVDPTAKFTTEYNLTSLLNKLLDRKAFVITDEVVINNDIISNLEFNIMGYLFNISSLNITNFLMDSSNKYLNATITVNISKDGILNNPVYNYWTLNSEDNTNTDDGQQYYDGIIFTPAAEPTFIPMLEYKKEYKPDLGLSSVATINEDTSFAQYTFTILEKLNDNTIRIPPDSKIKFQTNLSGRQHSLAIDDGELLPLEATTQIEPAIEPTRFNLYQPTSTNSDLILTTTAITLKVGDIFRLDVDTISNSNMDILYHSSDSEKVAVGETSGIIQAKAITEEDVTITVKDNNTEKQVTCTVKVIE